MEHVDGILVCKDPQTSLKAIVYLEGLVSSLNISGWAMIIL